MIAFTAVSETWPHVFIFWIRVSFTGVTHAPAPEKPRECTADEIRFWSRMCFEIPSWNVDMLDPVQQSP
jgi:hypothetical protein